MDNWITAVGTAILALLGIFLASRAVDGAIYAFGLLMFLFGVLFNFYIIHRKTDAHAAEQVSAETD